MRAKLKTVLLAVLITSPVATFAMNDAPKYCPGVEAIKQVPFVRAQVDGWLGWLAVSPTSKYDTQEEWTTALIVGNKAENEDEAVSKANSLSPLLQISSEVPQKQQDGYWCFYSDKTHEVGAYAFTPAYVDLGKKLAKMKKVFG